LSGEAEISVFKGLLGRNLGIFSNARLVRTPVQVTTVGVCSVLVSDLLQAVATEIK